MIKFACDACGHTLTVSDNHAGKRVRCPKCGKVLAIPKMTDQRPTEDMVGWVARPVQRDEGYTLAPIPTRQTTKACPFCGEDILETAKKCNHCEEFLDVSLRRVSAAPLGSPISYEPLAGQTVLSAPQNLPNENNPYVANDDETTESSTDKVAIGVAIFVVVAVVGMVVWAVFIRDPWEKYNLPVMENLRTEAIACVNAGQIDAGYAKYEELFKLVGERKLKKPETIACLADAQKEYRTLRVSEEEKQYGAKLSMLTVQAQEDRNKARYREAIASLEQIVAFDPNRFWSQRLRDVTVEAKVTLGRVRNELASQEKAQLEAEQARQRALLETEQARREESARRARLAAEAAEAERENRENAKGELDRAIIEAAKEGLDRILKAPSTARLAGAKINYKKIAYSEVTRASKNLLSAVNYKVTPYTEFYLVWGEVDAQNGFGAMVRGGWVMEVVVETSQDKYLAVALDGGITHQR